MAASTITESWRSYTFITLRGAVDPMGMISRSIRRANVDGKAFHHVGQNSPPSSFFAQLDIVSDVQDTVESLKALAGKAVTLTDDLGVEWDAYVLSFTPLRIHKSALGVGGVNGGSYLLSGVFAVEATEVPS